MTAALAAKWDAHYRATPQQEPLPSAVLSENMHLLPEFGTALDLACGIGGNALFLARRGLAVTARDISSVAVQQLRNRAEAERLAIVAEVCDIEQLPWKPERYDLVTVKRYLNRSLVPSIVAVLNPGGLLFYQTFTAAKLTRSGPNNTDYLLGDNELLDLFRHLRVRFYREDARCGDLSVGCRDEAYFVGQKPFADISRGTTI